MKGPRNKLFQKDGAQSLIDPRSNQIMRKSLWIEVVEWCLFVAVALFFMGVIAMRSEITSSAQGDSQAPRVSIDE